MPIGNGGIIGPANVPTLTTASGVWSLREQQQAQGRGAWPLAIATDPYFEYTTLLLPGNGTNGANNNTFLDGSTNNFTITRSGNTTQGTFSPFSQTGWGNYFNGSNAYFSFAAQTDFAFGTGDFTIETFVFFQLTAATSQTIIDFRPNGLSGAYPTVNIGGGNFVYTANGATRIRSDVIIDTNRWYHLVVSRVGTTTRMFIDGVEQTQTYNDSTNYIVGASRPVIGIGGFNLTGLLNGYLSNLRILKGTGFTSVTVPTAPFATGTANQVLLTCQANRFIDSNTATTEKTIAVTGSPSVAAFSPFNPTLPWIASINGGSGYFDGSGDSLGAPSNVALAVGTSDFSLDCWIYTNTSSSTPFFIFDTRNADDDQSGFVIYRRATGKLTFAYSVGVTFTAYEGATTLNGNTWYHVAVTRVSNELRLFVNGVLDRSPPTVSTNFSRQTNILVGAAWSSATSNGYISNLRLTKGGIPTLFSTSSTTSGTAIFTPPSTPTTSSDSLTAGSLSLLLNFTNAGIYDATSKNDLETLDNTVNGVRISTAQSQFGGSSIYFDGTGTDYLWIQADQPIQRFGTAPFTIELWIRLAATGSARGLVAKGTSTTGWLVSLNTSNQVVFTYGTSTITSTGTISAGVWTYIAVVREGTGANQTKIYIGGVNDGTGTVSTDFTQTSSVYIGADRTGGSLFSGYMQDVRITNGYARTVTTIPTTAFPVV